MKKTINSVASPMTMCRSSLFFLICTLISAIKPVTAMDDSAAPFRVAVAGLAHGHVAGFFDQALKRPGVQIVGIAEPDRTLFDRYAKREGLNSNLYFPSLEAMISSVRPEAVVLYTNTFDHRAAVEICAKHHISVMMEKPLAVSYRDALAMAAAARAGNIHVLVNYETTWYASNKAAHDLLGQGALGDLRKMVFRDGHQGPKEINVQPEFLAWLTNPKLNGAGALYDFGCYGADLATWLTHGQRPVAVTAVTQRIKPAIYSQVDDEADVIVSYPKAIAILQGSWNWPYSIKDMQVFGTSASVQTVLRDKVSVRHGLDDPPQITAAEPLQPPYDDSLHYFAGVVRGQIPDDDANLSSLRTNLVVSEILDAARQSAESGRTIALPVK